MCDFFHEEDKIKFKLLTKPTQFTRGKTEDTLKDIMERWLEYNYIDNEERDKSTHLIDIIVTNKSLQETQQWKYRTATKFKNFEDININILSSRRSKDNDKEDHYNNIQSYIRHILRADDRKKLPNILIVCYHTKRVCDDIIELCETFSGKHTMTLPRIEEETKLKFHISLDEPDANIGVTKTFLSKINQYIQNDFILGVLFITATPISDFWKMLEKNGISKLLNMNKNNTYNFNEDLKNYRSFTEHNITEHNNMTRNPLEYIEDLFKENKIDETKRKIIFSPGHLYTKAEGVGSHNEIVNYFTEKNYTVLLLNGGYKGFIEPDGTNTHLDDYVRQNKIEGELKESLRFWSENNQGKNLAITGYWVIERGVTFNTTNFNFTDMILSSYHLSSEGKLIQLSGRATGGKEYVDVMNVFCTTQIKDTIIKFNENLKQICNVNPEFFNRTDFLDSKNSIPVKLKIKDEALLKKIQKLRNEGKRGYKTMFHKHLSDGIKEGGIEVFDENNGDKRFDIEKRIIKDVRMYKKPEDGKDGKEKDRRFKQFNDAFKLNKSVAQAGDENSYSVDFAFDPYIYEGFINPTNIFWITYKIS